MSLPRRLLRWALLAAAGLAVACVIALGVVYYLIAPQLPDVETLHDVELQEPMYVYARDGRLMAVFGEVRRYPAEIDAVPERLKQAFIAIEDNRFYEHRGVDYVGVARAVWLLLTTDDERVPGGSTITQQVARQFFLSTEYSYTRKIAEMMLAWRMERELSKDEIFELYLNRSFFGNRAYGVTAAAEFYYGKDLAELSLDEMASLAGIPKFPSSGNPVSNPERARIRRDYILERMADLDFISDAEKSAAQRVPMHATPHEPPIQLYAPYVAEMVRQEMIDRFGAEAMTKGYHVVTTIDPEMQRAANQAVRDGLATYDSRHGWHGVEQHFDLAEGEDAETAKARLRGIATQTDMLPALVLATGDGSATVVLRSGREVTLGRDQGWNGRNPASLVKRGDVVRVHRVDTGEDAGDEGATTAAGEPAAPRYELTQIPRAQSALVSMEADTGALRALTGGFSFAGSKFNRATQAKRQPGSSFKPFLYAASFERGFNPASVVLDAPVVFRDRAGNTWRPQNDDARFLGPMRLREALVRSRNLVSVRLLDAIGVDYARKYISHFGFDEDSLPPNLSMSLGTASLTPLSIARGYAVFANGGFRVTPWLIKEVKDRDGAVIFEENPLTACPYCGGGARTATAAASGGGTVIGGFNLGPATAAAEPAAVEPEAPAEPETPPADMKVAPRAIDGRIAYQIESMLRDVVQRGTGTKAKVLGREDVGGKTGSTNDHRDAWFSGLGGGLVTTVWVGRDNFESLGRGEYGGKAALPVWIDYMRVALEGRPVKENLPPAGMVEVGVAANGSLLPNASGGITEWVKTEDLERMQAYAEYDSYGPDASQAEETFDIF
ncbi:peptidase [Lysobacter arseniciresistens ZS79]|uniref:Penicillin-binding protein 1A n=1 Tax=Lysobacter arseniciresistens ZS79 TaxID=913325 RepID=A0A0A0EZJ2_9GAMM|nr:penicillin-binding protein 1A [Lysobacter arseniciresistens]KGM55720.1 peptidase [Lysobacter arseniciresistens ZS79]